MANIPWTETEINSAIIAYFELLEAQKSNAKTNKAEIYRALNKKHPIRSPKSFEFKFQNISAVLYEQKLPFADGLRPKANYQAALKEHILAYLDKAGLKKQSAIEILTTKLQRLHRRDYLKIHGAGSGRFGLSLEHYLNIPQNSSKDADFMGIELKTKHDKGLQTLFSRVPTSYLACKDKTELVTRFGYYDSKRKRQALYTSFNNQPDSLGFYMTPKESQVVVNKKRMAILDYDGETLRDALLEKHNETAYVAVSSKKLKNGKVGCRFEKLLYCKTPSYAKFIRMARDGYVYLDLTLSVKAGKSRDHGFLWRIPHEKVAELYQVTRLIDLCS